MTPEAHRRNAVRSQCTGKRRLRDHDEAVRVRKACENARGKKLRTYECPHCGGFHLTEQELRK